MVSLITPSKAQEKLAENARLQRLQLELTQAGLAERASVPLPTLRKFEQQGVISLESFLKLQMVLGGLEPLVQATSPKQPHYTSIDDVLEDSPPPTRKRGRKK